jgi:hypothetical protein
MYYKRNIGARSRNYCCSGKAVSVTYSVCVFVVLGIQRAVRLRHVSCHLWSVRLYCTFPRFLINGTIVEKALPNVKYVFWFSLQLLSETFLILRRTGRDTIINMHRSSCSVPLILSDFIETWIFLTDFRKILQYQMSWKSVQWEPSSMRTDGESDRRDETNSRLSQLCERA